MTILLIDGVGRQQPRDVPEDFGPVYRMAVDQPTRRVYTADESLTIPDFPMHEFHRTGEYLLRGGGDGLAILPIYRLKAGA